MAAAEAFKAIGLVQSDSQDVDPANKPAGFTFGDPPAAYAFGLRNPLVFQSN